MNPDDPKLRYVISQVEKPGSQGTGIWAGYVTYERRLLGVAEGIDRTVVMRLLRRKVEAGDEPKGIVALTFFNNTIRGRRKLR